MRKPFNQENEFWVCAPDQFALFAAWKSIHPETLS
jgi:hypothetical protein